MKLVRVLCSVLALLAGGGCGTPPPPPVPPKAPPRARKAAPVKLVMEPIKLQAVPGTVGPDVKVVDAGSLFERGGQLLSNKRYREAIAAYDQLLKTFPGSRYLSPTLYNAGLCHEWLGEFQRAADRYKELIRQFGPTKEAVDAGFRLGGCYAELRNWAASAQVFGTLLARSDISASDRIEAMARKGLAHFRLGDARSCKSTLEQAVRYHRSIEAAERLDTDFFLGMAHYYLAALPHVEFRGLTVQADAALAKTLDEKARLLLESQSGYIRTIKVKNPYWATASGFQVGSLYREFYTVLLTTLPDFSRQAARNARLARVSREEARRQLIQVYLEEVHKAVKPLLQKAIRVFEKNVQMAQRVGVESNWVGKSRRQVQELKHLLSVPPSEAVELVRKEQQLPEDRPPLAQPPQSQPASQPAAPTPEPPRDEADEPGRVVL